MFDFKQAPNKSKNRSHYKRYKLSWLRGDKLVYRIRKVERGLNKGLKTPILILTMRDNEGTAYLFQNQISAYIEKCCEPEIMAEVL